MNRLFVLLFAIAFLGTSDEVISQNEIHFGGELFQFTGTALVDETTTSSTSSPVVRRAKEVKVITGAVAFGYGRGFILKQFGEQSAIVASPAIIANVFYIEDLIAGAKMPLSLLFRHGGHVVDEEDTDLSLGIGGGYTINALHAGHPDFTENVLYGSPSALLEVGKADWKVRVDVLLLPHTSYYKSYTGDIPGIIFGRQLSVTYTAWWF